MKTFLPCIAWLLKCIFLTGLLAICALYASTQTIDFGKSYMNLTKGLNGGTIEPGDTLEIRASFVVRSGTYDSCGYFDVVPAGTIYIPNTIRVLTNEGKIYKQFTDIAGDDCGWITGGNVRINLGFNPAAAPATAFRRGRIANTHKPTFNNTCIMVASFRVRVNVPIGSNISTGGGSMTYKNGSASLQTFIFPSNIVRVYTNFGICPNTVGTNSLGTEFNGTFGSGKPRNRVPSANVPPGYTYNTFTTNMPNDYYYGVANNTSTQTYSTVNTWPKPDPDPDGAGPLTTHRVFSVWDIIGDHTGAVSPTAGNPAADTVANNNGGYMLVINAAYRIDSAFVHTIDSLCPNTYYEISCWMRNICSKCGSDSNGRNATSTGSPAYIPTGPGDSSGVAPNLTFEIDGVDYYTSGNLRWSGQWVKKGFTFLTGPSQTSFTLKFFNNAPGGGGNDWALDDIAVATCTPNLTLLPSANPTVCAGNVVNMSAIVRSYFNNYTFFKWQKSTNNGATWVNDGPASGPITPTWTGSEWQYTAVHPTFVANQSDSGTQFRIVIATTAANLNSAKCAFSQSTVITLRVLDCGDPLETNFLSLTGRMVGDKAQLNWTTSKEHEQLQSTIEKSIDGRNFSPLATFNNNFDTTLSINTYSYMDPTPVVGIVYYRVMMTNVSNQVEFSRVVQINGKGNTFNFGAVVNPFTNQLNFEITVSDNGKAEVDLIDPFGRPAKRSSYVVSPGDNNLILNNTGNLPTGVYTLRVRYNGTTLQKRVVKVNE